MTSWNWVIEHLATAVESFTFTIFILLLAGVPKDRKLPRRILVGAALETVLVVALNQIQLFSFVTPVITILLFSLYSFICIRKNYLNCLTAAITTLAALSAEQYAFLFFFGILAENPVADTRTFMLMMSPGPYRWMMLVVTKAVELCMALLFCRKPIALSRLNNKLTLFVFSVSTISYLLLNYNVAQILSGSLLVLQTSVIISMIFIAICILTVIILCFLLNDYRSEREKNELLTTMNELTESNYRKLSDLQKQMSKLNHDFAKHIQVIRGLLSENKNDEALSYTNELLKVPAERAVLCKSGNSVIDAVINSKIAETKEKNINFTYQVSFALKANISSVDICTVLGNQIDNAIEACEKIADPSSRRIAVHVYQQAANMAIFQVANTVDSNPFIGNEDLKTTKNTDNHLHGLGIPAIREVTARYDGILDTSYQNGEFLSSAMLYFEKGE